MEPIKDFSHVLYGEFISRDSLRSVYREILRSREEILVAFIAKYGCEPDEVEQVTDGVMWFVRKRQHKNEKSSQ